MMKAFVLAAGLGTRLRPFTLTNPKALVEVGGVPMLERVILRLKDEGFGRIVVNVHHFGGKIEDFLRSKDNFGLDIRISDERELLRDTGGGILYAMPMLGEDDEPFLVHNVDILSDASLRGLMENHKGSGAGATLLVSGRESSRRLLFRDGGLCGWKNENSGEYKPAGYLPEEDDRAYAFSGIHVMSPRMVRREMERQGRQDAPFSVIDFYLSSIGHMAVRGEVAERLQLIDIGKPETLARANALLP